MEGSCTVFGDRGTCKIGGPYLNRIDHFEVENRTLPLLDPTPGPNQYGTYEGSMSNHDKVYEQLIRELNNEEDKLVDAAEALKTIEIIEKIYAASPMGSLHP
jgi:UDP-N-acetyl-2-amino-2-deoxyglucuronate dehydrogenase